jgi:hypothetical protein
MDVMYDDTCLKVMGLHERSSLSPEDVSVIASLDSAHSAGGRFQNNCCTLQNETIVQPVADLQTTWVFVVLWLKYVMQSGLFHVMPRLYSTCGSCFIHLQGLCCHAGNATPLSEDVSYIKS